MWERADLLDFASLAKLYRNEVTGTLHRALRLSCTPISNGKLFEFDGQTASPAKLFPLQTHDCATGHRSIQQSHQVKSSEHIFAVRGGCVVGWFGRTVGCKPPRGEQMRMTRWNPAAFPTAPSTPAPQLYYSHSTPAKHRSGVVQSCFYTCLLPQLIPEPTGGASVLPGPEQSSFGAAPCCYCCWSCSAQLSHLPSRCLQGVFVLTLLMHENSHKTRCSAPANMPQPK